MSEKMEQMLVGIDTRLQTIEKNQVESSTQLKTIHQRGCFRGEERFLETGRENSDKLRDLHRRIDGQRNIAGVGAAVATAFAAIWSYLK